MSSLLLVLLYVGYGYLSLLLHELSHASVVLISKQGQITDFKVYPHTYKGYTYLGRVGFTGLTRSEARLAYLAPLVKSTLLSALLIWLCFSVSPLFLGMLVWELFDMALWIKGWAKKIPGSDGCRYRALKIKKTS